MEEITKETATISEPAKAKKPRTAAQMEAFKKCVANRKANIDKRKSLSANTNTESKPAGQVAVAPASVDSTAQIVAKQVEELKKQMEENNRAIEEYKEHIRREYEAKHLANNSIQAYHSPDIDIDNVGGMEIDELPQSKPIPMHAPKPSASYTYRPQHVNRGGYADDVGFYDPSTAQSRKRDIRGMDPYADEKRGMLEKIYARNTNAYRQNLIEQQRRSKMASEDSIQILAPRIQQQQQQQQEMQEMQEMRENQASTPSVDRWDPVENMKAMIRGEKGKYTPFNGIRLPSTVRKLKR